MTVIETARLRLEQFQPDDAEFILQLVNEPAWLAFIGDKGVRNLDDARTYLANGPIAMYARCGFGLYRVDLKASGAAIGMCGLIRRDTLPDVDIGYALLPGHWGQGYAEEAARATLQHARDTLRLPRLLAIVSPDNARSIRLLEKLGLCAQGLLETDAAGGTALYGIDLAETHPC
jgi:[ribosomal protein S5]-alanine N-acetyltransferase